MKQFNKTKLWENMIQSNPHNNGFLTASVWVFSVFRELPFPLTFTPNSKPVYSAF